jgi:hypothetical protein
MAGQQVVPGSYSERIDHYSVLRTLQDAFGLGTLANSGTATPITDIWSGSTPPPSDAPFVSDSFSRSVTGGWGSADVGGRWTTTGTASGFSVSGGTGGLRTATGGTLTAALAGVSSDDSDVVTSLSVDKAQTGNGVYLTVAGRRVSAGNEYRAKLRVTSAGRVVLNLAKVVGGAETALSGQLTVPGVTVAPGVPFSVRVQVTGSGPTTVRARVWPTSGTEPSGWMQSVTDATAGLQGAGGIGLSSYLSSSSTNGPVTVRVGPITATHTG